jgi:DNA polymerase III delta subunit
MESQLMFKNFDTKEQLVEYVNDKKIKMDCIQSIICNDLELTLFYWIEGNFWKCSKSMELAEEIQNDLVHQN